MQQLEPASYIVIESREVLLFAAEKLETSPEKLALHPDFHLINAKDELSLGIEKIREASSRLRMRPWLAPYHFLVITDFHFATIDAQNAFLKAFEEPPEYAYIFLVTPYIDRLLKTIVSRAQLLESDKRQAARNKEQKLEGKVRLESVVAMSVGERFLWLDMLAKGSEKADTKQLYISLINELLEQGMDLLKKKRVEVASIEALKEAKWKIEQGFPLPKLLIERFLLSLP